MIFDENVAGENLATINELNQVSYADMNRGVKPVFEIQRVINPVRSIEKGEAVHDQVECVRLIIAGETLNQGVFPADEAMRRRFSAEYALWKSNAEPLPDGTSLSRLDGMMASISKEFEALNVFSVEDLASVSDINIVAFSDGRAWRARARAFLGGKDLVDKGEMDKTVASLEDRIKELEKLLTTPERVERLKPAMMEAPKKDVLLSKGERSKAMKAAWARRKEAKANESPDHNPERRNPV